MATFVLVWRQFLRPAEVNNMFDHVREPKPQWRDCLVTKIKKNQNMLKTFEYDTRNRLTKFGKFDVFRYRLKTASLIGISWIIPLSCV